MGFFLVKCYVWKGINTKTNLEFSYSFDRLATAGRGFRSWDYLFNQRYWRLLYVYCKVHSQCLTIIHNWNASFIVNQGWKWEYSDLMGQFGITGLYELNTVFVCIVINCLQLFQNSRTWGALVIIWNSKFQLTNLKNLIKWIITYKRTQLNVQLHWWALEESSCQQFQSHLEVIHRDLEPIRGFLPLS